MSSAPPSPVKSALRTLDIIEYVVARPDGAVAQDIAGALAIPVSSLSYLLNTLVDRGYLRRDGRRYAAGAGLERLRGATLSATDRARPLVRALRTRSNETSSFFTRHGWEMEAVVTETADHSLRYSIAVGVRSPMHCLAAGKAMLAAMAEEELGRYFAEAERPRFTPATIVEEAALRRELDAIRGFGVAVTREEFTPGICGIATLLRVDGQPVGSLSVAMPTARFDDAVLSSTAALLESLAAGV